MDVRIELNEDPKSSIVLRRIQVLHEAHAKGTPKSHGIKQPDEHTEPAFIGWFEPEELSSRIDKVLGL